MANWAAHDWILIIGAIGTLITSIIAALKAGRAEAQSTKSNIKLDENKMLWAHELTSIRDKTDTIQEQTNGNVAELRAKIRAANEINNHLLEVITALIDQLPEGSLLKAKKELDELKSQIGYRRAGDAGLVSNFSQENLSHSSELKDPATRQKEKNGEEKI